MSAGASSGSVPASSSDPDCFRRGREPAPTCSGIGLRTQVRRRRRPSGVRASRVTASTIRSYSRALRGAGLAESEWPAGGNV